MMNGRARLWMIGTEAARANRHSLALKLTSAGDVAAALGNLRQTNQASRDVVVLVAEHFRGEVRGAVRLHRGAVARFGLGVVPYSFKNECERAQRLGPCRRM